MTPISKPLKPEPKKAKGIDRRPRCACGCRFSVHSVEGICGGNNLDGGVCSCFRYVPRPRLSRSAPVRKDVKPKRKKLPNKVRKTGRAALGRLADKLCGALVRARGACEECGRSAGVVLQWAHGFSRRYHATRWLPINGFCLCSGDHYKFGLRPLEFDCWLRERWGQPVYDELRRIALENKRVDLEAVVASLRSELAARGIE